MEEKKQALGKEAKITTEEILKEVEAKVENKVDKKEEVKLEVKPKETTPEIKLETKPEIKPEESPTIGEVLKNEKSEKKEVRTVPEATFLEMKKDNKELKKDIKDLKTLIEEGGSKQQVSESLKEIAEEHNVDVDLLSKLSKNIKQEVEADYSAKMKPLEEKEKAEKRDAVLNSHYDKTLEAMPEYKDIANKEVVKSLALLEENADKTIPQILEKAYGHLVQGKKTIDSGSPARAGGDTEVIIDIDFDKAQKDEDYMKKLMANPELKKKYNEHMLKNVRF